MSRQLPPLYALRAFEAAAHEQAAGEVLFKGADMAADRTLSDRQFLTGTGEGT